MPIDPGIIGQLQPPPPPPSVEQQARTQLLVEEAKQRRQAVIEEAQDSAAIQTAFRAHQSETGTDYQGVLRDLGTASPRAAMKFQVFLTKQQDDAAKQQQEEWKAQSAQAEGLTRLFQGIDKTPDPAASYLAAKQLLPPNIAKTLPETYDPTVTERIVAHGMSVKDFNDKEQQAFDRVMGKGTTEQGVGETLALTTSPEDFKNRLSRLSFWAPKDMLDPYRQMGPTPEMVQHAQQAALGTKEVATLAGQAEGRAQTAQNEDAQRMLQKRQQDLEVQFHAATDANEKARIRLEAQRVGLEAQRVKDEQAAATMAAQDIGGASSVTMSGRRYVSMGEFETPKAREAARIAAAKAGIPVVDKATGDSLRSADNARLNINAVMSQIENVLPKDATGRLLAGPENKLSKYFQSNDQIAAFGSWRTAAIQAVQALAEKGMGLRLNQTEINMILDNDIPQITDTLGTARQRVQNFMTLLKDKEDVALTKDRSTLAPGATTTTAPAGSIKVGKYTVTPIK